MRMICDAQGSTPSFRRSRGTCVSTLRSKTSSHTRVTCNRRTVTEETGRLVATGPRGGPSDRSDLQCRAREQRNLLARATSPDGAWVASIYNNVCSDGAFVTTIDDSVEITRSNEQASPIPSTGTVFGMDHHPFDVQKPLAVTWTGQQRCRARRPAGAAAGHGQPAARARARCATRLPRPILRGRPGRAARPGRRHAHGDRFQGRRYSPQRRSSLHHRRAPVRD
jgi:hypothetical protein